MDVKTFFVSHKKNDEEQMEIHSIVMQYVCMDWNAHSGGTTPEQIEPC